MRIVFVPLFAIYSLFVACGPSGQGTPSACDGRDCDVGFHCEEVQVQCVTTPCNPVAECIADDPCALALCEEGQHCEEVQVQCVQAPCPPQAQCVDDEIDPNDYERCNTYRCPPGQECRSLPDGDECVDIQSDISCANVRCIGGHKCVDQDEGPACVPLECSDIDCGPNQGCEENDETGATCFFNSSCANVRCDSNTTCVETEDGPRCVELIPEGVE